MIDLAGKGDRIAVGVSGGKDSAATCLWLMEQGLGPDDYDRVFCDTGWELPEVYAYLRGPLTDAVGPVVELQPMIPDLRPELEELARGFEARLGFRSAMVRLVLSKGIFPSRKIRFCTETLKAKTSATWMRAQDAEMVNVIGIRAEESRARAEMEPWEWSKLQDCWVWRPLLTWTFNDVIAIHQRHGLVPASPYLDGAFRVGCAPCIMARKSEIAWLADRHPERIALLHDLEQEVRKRAEAMGAQHPPAWFQDPNPPRKPGTRKVIRDARGYQSMWPILKVVEWARGPRGQVELFAPSREDGGCMRWGFCDTAPAGGER